ncbi:ABC transporter permease [Oleispirillum naphthae]|uniref:ABC transporter permease n=1 Tax=Oleispirillum naphthae TaxID=2838853 RepID=UPI0030825AFE
MTPAERRDAQARSAFAGHRLFAIVLRHLYVMRTSWPRLLEMAYWPTVQMIVWGFASSFFRGHSSWVAQAAGVLIGAVLLWEVMFRANLGFSLSFLEEMWSRNLGQLYLTPLRPHEHVAALAVMSLIRTCIGLLPPSLLAIALYDFNIYGLGLPLIAFFANLMVMGWSVGLFTASLVLRFGMGAESLAWVLIFGLSPLAGIYYPISTLPGWLQHVAYALPPAYVFEGMRAVMFDHVFRWDLFIRAAALNAVYFTGFAAFFLHMVRVARRKGLFLNMGE